MTFHRYPYHRTGIRYDLPYQNYISRIRIIGLVAGILGAD